jgi:hypothetical protein
MNIFKLVITTSAALKTFIKGDQYIYITDAIDNVSGTVGTARTCLKIGMTTNGYERLRAYITMNTNLTIELYKVADAAQAESVIKQELRNYSLGRELFDLDALKLARKIAKTLSV